MKSRSHKIPKSMQIYFFKKETETTIKVCSAWSITSRSKTFSKKKCKQRLTIEETRYAFSLKIPKYVLTKILQPQKAVTLICGDTGGVP